MSAFPFDAAAAYRIRMIGKSLIKSGHSFDVYTNTIHYNSLNTDAKGQFDGIPYVYLHGTIELNRSFLIKWLLFVKGLFKLVHILFEFDKRKDIVYVYANGYNESFNLFVLLFCKLFGLKVVQEINEWQHNDLNQRWVKFLMEGPVTRWSDGVVAISHDIKEKVLICNPNLKTIVIPVLGDFREVRSDEIIIQEVSDSIQYCFWMGLVDGYIQDVLFVINACARSFHDGVDLHVVIAGGFSEESKNRIIEEAEQCCFPVERIRLLGYVSEVQLDCWISRAKFFMVPMWISEKSKYRFPTKISFFMFAGKPLITCAIGELGRILEDKKNVLFFRPSDIDDASAKIKILFDDKRLYESISENTKLFANEKLCYTSYSDVFGDFFQDIIGK